MVNLSSLLHAKKIIYDLFDCEECMANRLHIQGLQTCIKIREVENSKSRNEIE